MRPFVKKADYPTVVMIRCLAAYHEPWWILTPTQLIRSTGLQMMLLSDKISPAFHRGGYFDTAVQVANRWTRSRVNATD